MSITNIAYGTPLEHPIVFRDSALAHKYLDGLNGIEIGAAAHNPFHLIGSTSVGLVDKDYVDYDFFRSAQAMMCGAYAKVEINAEADDLPLEDGSQDYVITSHVVEHIPNLIKTFIEWNRVIRENGYIFMIFPKRDALPDDRNRPITLLKDYIRAYEENWSVDSMPIEFLSSVPGGRRGHYWVFTLDTMLALIGRINSYAVHWDVIDALETDDKVGNGHCVVLQKTQPMYFKPLFQSVKEITHAYYAYP